MITSSVSGHAAEDTQHKYPYMVDGHILRLKFTENIYELHLQQSSGGTIAGSPLSGVSGTVFNLTATPTGRHEFDSFSITGAALTGSAGTYINSDVTAVANFNYIPLPVYTITLQTSGKGSITASKLTAESGETITIGATPSAYNRFDQYYVTGGTVTGNNLTVTADCTAMANFVSNTFVASGTYSDGGSVISAGNTSYVQDVANIPMRTLYTTYHTSNTPTGYYANGRWITSGVNNVSAYKLTMNATMPIHYWARCSANAEPSDTTAAATGCLAISSQNSYDLSNQFKTNSFTPSRSGVSTSDWDYTMSYTTNTTGAQQYGVSGKLQTNRPNSNLSVRSSAWYVCGTMRGSWSASGIIP